MRILGINYLSESSVCLLENGKLKYAISEERINRVKNWYGSPLKSIKECLDYFNLKLKDIDFQLVFRYKDLIFDYLMQQSHHLLIPHH